jgi:hypothetical protein
MGRACSTNGEKLNTCRILVGNPERKRSLGRPRLRWMDNDKVDLRGIGCGGMGWIGLAQESSCEHGNEPSVWIKCWEILE